MRPFLETLQSRRRDDDRFCRQSRMNQSPHIVIGMSFRIACAMLFVSPASAARVGWVASMVARKSWNFLFEPVGYDRGNNGLDEPREETEVCHHLRRRMMLIAIWAMAPQVPAVDPMVRHNPA